MDNRNKNYFKILCKRFNILITRNSINYSISLMFLFIVLFFWLNTFEWLFSNFDWEVVQSNLHLYTFGSFPKSQQWRPAIWLISLIFLFFLTVLGPNKKWIQKISTIGWICTLPLGIFLLYGNFGLTPVMSRNFGGLTLTIFLTVCSSFFSLPIGIALAFCRKSSLQLIRKISSIYIDIMRSVPLISVLFFGQLLIPLFLPAGIQIDRVWRAIFAFTLFVSAYIAEDIRGGLQSIPKTQVEAANSIGLNKFQIIWFILIPQSIQTALPALTNQSIGLFQNTSLMSILGLVELLGVGRSILANPEFIGQYIEVYIWLAFLYWIICTIMALIARSIEKKLNVN